MLTVVLQYLFDLPVILLSSGEISQQQEGTFMQITPFFIIYPLINNSPSQQHALTCRCEACCCYSSCCPSAATGSFYQASMGP